MLEMAPPLALLLLPLALGLPHPEERVQAGIEEEKAWMEQQGCTIQYDEDYWISEGYTNATCMKLCDKNTGCQQWAWWGGACWLRNTKEQCTAKVFREGTEDYDEYDDTITLEDLEDDTEDGDPDTDPDASKKTKSIDKAVCPVCVAPGGNVTIVDMLYPLYPVAS